ncbi:MULTISPECIES: hypothetical protein [unclassified Yoonia]|uniref:hypothetical protein n=1 Tax=unclassified Yoonia TaxID=2629118 RepID=UPI002AFEA882|nr:MULTISPECIES: hypothetical protein [unclassified Yoonia]
MYDQIINDIAKRIISEIDPQPLHDACSAEVPNGIPQQPGYDAKDSEEEDDSSESSDMHLRKMIANVRRYYDTHELDFIIKAQTDIENAKRSPGWNSFEIGSAFTMPAILRMIERQAGECDETFGVLVDTVFAVEKLLDERSGKESVDMSPYDFMVEAISSTKAFFKTGDRSLIFDAQDHARNACMFPAADTLKQHMMFLAFYDAINSVVKAEERVGWGASESSDPIYCLYTCEEMISVSTDSALYHDIQKVFVGSVKEARTKLKTAMSEIENILMIRGWIQTAVEIVDNGANGACEFRIDTAESLVKLISSSCQDEEIQDVAVDLLDAIRKSKNVSEMQVGADEDMHRYLAKRAKDARKNIKEAVKELSKYADPS